MILIADSGSTKTSWSFLGHQGKTTSVETQGMNPYFTSSQLMTEIIGGELLPACGSEPPSHIYFYGAGCSTAANNQRISDTLHLFFPDAMVVVEHDILGTARALFGDEPGIACILGTGSNSCWYDGITVHTPIPSLGYLFGDEGAGSSLGKKLMGHYLRRTLPGELQEAFSIRYPLKLEEILTSLYNKPFPNRFLASFTLFLSEHTGHPFIQSLVRTSFCEFVESQILPYPQAGSVPAGFTGSIAVVFRDILSAVLEEYRIPAGSMIRQPMDGLVTYHRSRFPV